jgi:hypothetical protein
MGWNNEIFSLLIVTSGGGFTGLFVYSPAPGAGNLIASVAAQAGTDPYGNAYSRGVASYAGGGTAESLLTGGLMQLIATAFQSAPATFNVSGSAGNTAAMAITSGAGTEAGAVQSVLELGDSGAGTGLQVVDGADGNTYDTERITLVNTAAQTISSTANTVITGLSKPVAAGRYFFRGLLRSKQGAVNVTQNVGFQGPANNQCVWFWNESNQASVSINAWVVQGGLATIGIGFGAVNNENYFEFTGTVNFTAAGTFSAVAAEGTPGDSFVIEPGCIMEIGPVRAS